MEFHTSTQQSSTSLDRAFAVCLAAFSMFVIGYTATRVYLSQPSAQGTTDSVVPHQAALWSELGQ